MTTKITLILVASLLVPGCMKKPDAAKPKDSGGEANPAAEGGKAGNGTDREAEANKAAATNPSGTGGGAGNDGGAAAEGQAAGGAPSDGGAAGARPTGPAKIPNVPKTVVVTISMGAQDYDVFIGADKTAWRIPMKAKANDLSSIAVRAKAVPEAVDSQVTVFLGNSVEPAVGQSMMEALRTAGFKTVKMSIPRQP